VRQIRLISDGGHTMWLVTQDDDFSIAAWSLTLPDTASHPEDTGS
jgi:hypothetical protein